jgi:hypothetical protein
MKAAFAVEHPTERVFLKDVKRQTSKIETQGTLHHAYSTMEAFTLLCMA